MIVQSYSASTLSRLPSVQGRPAVPLFPRTPQDTITLGPYGICEWARWPSGTAIAPGQLMTVQARVESMRQLIDSWLADDADEQRRTLEYLRRALRESGLSSRPRL